MYTCSLEHSWHVVFFLVTSQCRRRWRIQWAAEGVLNARVDVGVGELQMVRGSMGPGISGIYPLVMADIAMETMAHRNR